MEENFNKHLGSKLKLRRLSLGLTQTKVAKAINVTFQQIQKYEKGTNGVSSIRLLQLSNYLKVPINYFFEDFSEYLINGDKSKESPSNVNYTRGEYVGLDSVGIGTQIFKYPDIKVTADVTFPSTVTGTFNFTPIVTGGFTGLTVPAEALAIPTITGFNNVEL